MKSHQSIVITAFLLIFLVSCGNSTKEMSREELFALRDKQRELALDCTQELVHGEVTPRVEMSNGSGNTAYMNSNGNMVITPGELVDDGSTQYVVLIEHKFRGKIWVYNFINGNEVECYKY